jgi:O-antigen/teichoic acid export membrane protein
MQAVYFVLLARMLGPLQYGIYAGSLALVTIVSQYSTFGSGFLVLRHVSPDHRKFAQYWGNVLLSTAVIGGILIIAIRAFGGAIAGKQAAPLLIFLAVADCWCGQLATCCGQIFQTFEDLRYTALLLSLTNILRVSLVCCLYVFLHHITARNWAIAQMGVSVCAAVFAVGVVLRLYGLPRLQAGLFRAHMVEAASFAVSGSTTSVYNDIDKTMLSHYGMNAANGVYSMAYRIVDMAAIPVRAIHSAAFPRFFRKGVEGLVATRDVAKHLLKRTLVFGFTVAVGMFIFAPIVPLLVGRGYAESSVALRWLCLIPLFRCFHLSAGDALTGAGFQNYRLGAQFLVAATNLGLNIWLIPLYGWHGAAWTSLFADGLLAIANWTIVNRLCQRERLLALV